MLRDAIFGRPRLPGPLRTLEGVALLGLGLFMVLLAAVGPYWCFLNPKFRWLTASTGGVLLLLGAAHPFLGARPRALRLVVLLAFLALAAYAERRAEGDIVQPAPQQTSLGMEVDTQAEQAASRETRDGREYVRLNVAELYLLTETDGLTPPQRFVTRGVVRRTPALDAAGEFALVRMSVICCLADAVAPGFTVRPPGVPPEVEAPGGASSAEDSPGGGQLAATLAAPSLPDGSWVRVYGRLEPLPEKAPHGDAVSLPGVIGTFVSHGWRIVPDRVEPVGPPEIPFIFEIRDAEPFAY